jgi:molybdopterin converting factor small subunit
MNTQNEIQNPRQLNLKLFGMLRKYSVDSSMTVLIPTVCTVLELKNRLNEQLKMLHPDSFDLNLLDECAFATNDKILNSDETLPAVEFIAVLPPVCGG